MVVDDNEDEDAVEGPRRPFNYNSLLKDDDIVSKDVTHLSVQVPRIEKDSFSNCLYLVEVNLYEGLQCIGECAFADCVQLKAIVIPSTVEIIEERAFSMCKSLVDAHLCEGLLKTLGKQAFAGCIKLPQISVPSTVEILCRGTFKGCTELADVELKEGLRRIGVEAFCDCKSLTRISVPSTVNMMDKNVFAGCESLVKAGIPTTLEELGDGMFTRCTSLRIFTGGTDDADHSPLNFRTIGMDAFGSCTALVKVSLSSTVEIIGDHAFSGCSLLMEVELSEGLTKIEQSAFGFCISLSGIHIPSTTLKIGKFAFIGCKSLIGVEFSLKCKTNLFQGCFWSCEALANMCFHPSMRINGTIKMSRGFRGLSQFTLGCHDDLMELVEGRLETMSPVQRLCYFASTTTVQDLRNEISLAQDDVKEVLEMTPFHIVATASKLRLDLLEVLLDHYPLDQLGWRDKRKKVMMDYLLCNPSHDAVPLITLVLKRTILGGMTNWGLEAWRTDMDHKLETIDWTSNRHGDVWYRDSWHQTRDEILASLAKHARVEVASILEMTLWKMKLCLAKTTPEQQQADRETCRTNCGSEVVISHVIGFYSDNLSSPLSAQSAYTAMSMFDHNVHWMEHVSPDPIRMKSYTGLDASVVRCKLV